MTDQALRRADELLIELVELVETARTLPMSSSSVLPRERVLDLLDELRETLPPEMDEARQLVAKRDAVLHDAFADATVTRERATEEAETIVADATRRAKQLVHDAEVQAYETVEAGKAEHGQLVSATGVHQAAARAAAELRQGAEAYDAEIRQEAEARHATLLAAAERFDADTRSEAERYAGKLTSDAEDYADRTLAELAATLHRSAATAEQGRIALAHRRSGGRSDGNPARPAADEDPYDAVYHAQNSPISA
jgi:cell division septum initiation protein DivIVA